MISQFDQILLILFADEQGRIVEIIKALSTMLYTTNINSIILAEKVDKLFCSVTAPSM